MDSLTGGEPPELRALLVLDQLAGVGPATLRRIVDRFGSAVGALRAPVEAFARVAGRRAAGERHAPEIHAVVDRAVARARELGMRVITWGAPEYPSVLRHLADPPPVLFLRGRHALLDGEAVAVTVVGARRATSRSRDIADRLGRRLGGAGVTVVSGMALGIDGATHRGALAADGNTIAVLGTGADVAYPRSHARLLRDVLDRGLVVSEFLPGTPALPHHFPRRNRILAALGRATVVVEAGARSGSLITVDHALDLGRDVWVVPGPIERTTCAGSNRLLADGARPLLSLSRFVAELVPDVELDERKGVDPSGPASRVLGALAERPLSGDEVAERLGLPVHRVLGLLTGLELQGVVRRLPGMRFGQAA